METELMDIKDNVVLVGDYEGCFNAGAFYGMMTAKNKVMSYIVYIKFKDGKECIVRLSPTFYNNMKAKFNSKALNKLANK